jgi:TrpR family transcriptional regulator, trp operon repressor
MGFNMLNNHDGWDQLLQLLIEINNKAILNDVLTSLLTPEEQENLAKRMLILQALMMQQHTQREIADIYEVSIAKITRGSNELKRMNKTVKETFFSLFSRISS